MKFVCCLNPFLFPLHSLNPFLFPLHFSNPFLHSFRSVAHSLFPLRPSLPSPLSLRSPLPSLPSPLSRSAPASTFPTAPTSIPTGRKPRGSPGLPASIRCCNTPSRIHGPYTNTLNEETTLCMIEFHRTLQNELRARRAADFSRPSELLQLQQHGQKLRFRLQQIA